MNELQVFNFGTQELRTQLIDDEPWLLGKDVADNLGYQNGSRDINRHVDIDDRKIITIFDGIQNREMIFINESGMFSLALGSKLKIAKEFKRWVTKEVLPSIRKTGGYQISKDPIVALRLMLQATEETKEEVEDVKNRVVNLEENVSINPGKYSYISKRISQKVHQVGKERKWTMNKEQVALLYKDLNKAVAEVSGVRTRSQLKEKHFDSVMDLIDDWEPSTATRMLIHNLEDEEAFPIAEEG